MREREFAAAPIQNGTIITLIVIVIAALLDET